MSAQDNDIYDWPLDWFGSHRAYRVDRAMKTVRRQLSGLMSDKPPGLLFEAAVLQDNPANGIPAHNFTLVRPYSSEKCDPILKSLRGKILDFLNTITTNKDLIDKTFDANWLSRAQKNFQDLGKGGSDPALLRRCFDDVVGVVTRLPVRGYTHQVLCEHYFSPDSIPRPLWYNTSVAEHADGELYGKITATPNNALKPAIQNKDQQPYPGCKLSQLDGLLMLSMLPLVTEHAERPSWRKLDLIAIPVHTIHRWNEPTFGTFLGWLYLTFWR